MHPLYREFAASFSVFNLQLDPPALLKPSTQGRRRLFTPSSSGGSDHNLEIVMCMRRAAHLHIFDRCVQATTRAAAKHFWQQREPPLMHYSRATCSGSHCSCFAACSCSFVRGRCHFDNDIVKNIMTTMYIVFMMSSTSASFMFVRILTAAGTMQLPPCFIRSE